MTCIFLEGGKFSLTFFGRVKEGFKSQPCHNLIFGFRFSLFSFPKLQIQNSKVLGASSATKKNSKFDFFVTIIVSLRLGRANPDPKRRNCQPPIREGRANPTPRADPKPKSRPQHRETREGTAYSNAREGRANPNPRVGRAY